METALSRTANHLCHIRRFFWIRPAVMYQSYFFMTTNGALNSEAPKNPGEAKTDDGEKSGDNETGKLVRDGSYGCVIGTQPVSWLSLLLLIITGVGMIFYYDREKKRHIEGGPFNLINHNGKPINEKDFVGKWTVMYFGFTYWPDICPNYFMIAEEKVGIEIVPVFIFVDPERDIVEQVREYVKEFHPKLIGLIGNTEEIKKAARAYRVYYMKTVEEDSDYLVNHFINNDIDSLSDGIIKEIKQYKPKK
ncbi:hypothetical protein K2173_021425 [Erythroxylum novogranatense]|uniref:Thioredoxin domain-containing protein n=1 Tax=Erythroxylum novogranatense TaxID=1862640 RepID=A0AAV8TYK3_9ROSI|nr:hypothetical protein K2173_021425 [Erythroxylum novogranatense]